MVKTWGRSASSLIFIKNKRVNIRLSFPYLMDLSPMLTAAGAMLFFQIA
jgi:hypothetical protein